MELILVFEGIDKSGKDTVIKEFNKLANYRYLIINRFTGTHIVYGLHKKRFKRNSKIIDSYLEMEEAIDPYSIMIYLYASDDTIADRLKKTKDTDIKIKDIKPLQKLYREYVTSMTKLCCIKINTDLLTAKEIAKILWKRLNI